MSAPWRARGAVDVAEPLLCVSGWRPNDTRRPNDLAANDDPFPAWNAPSLASSKIWGCDGAWECACECTPASACDSGCAAL